MRLFPDPPAALRGPAVAVGGPRAASGPDVAWTLTRRQILRWGLVGGTLVVLPSSLIGCGSDEDVVAGAAPVPDFLTAAEQRVLRSVVGRIVPTDDKPGAVDCGADVYINRLLSLVPDDNDRTAQVYAGGPFSGRNPFADSTSGTPSTHFPTNDFLHFLPLTRLQLLSWRVQILGSANVAGADFNSAVTGPVVGLRDQYRTGLASIQQASRDMHQADFDSLAPADQDGVLQAVDPGFVQLATGHTLEGMFCAPEYGGNKDLTGWKLIGYDGDSQPLGYSLFDETAVQYRERSDKPTSTKNPDEDFAGVDDVTQQFLKLLVRVVGGPHFP